MSNAYFTSRLAPLASARLQELYGRAGTAGEYVVAAELLEGASECLRKVQEQHVLARSLDANARARLLELAALLQAETGQVIQEDSWPELLANPTWLAIRASALSVLNELGFNLAAWEEHECESMRGP